MWIIIVVLALAVVIIFPVSLIIFYPFKLTEKWKRSTHNDFPDENKLEYYQSGMHRLAARIYGAENRGGTIIIFHGMGVCSDYYIPEARHFAAEGYRVVLPDDTGYRKNKGLFLGFPQAAKDAAAAVDTFADETMPTYLIGHSMGAYAACTALEDIGAKVCKVVTYSGLNSEVEMIDEFVDGNIGHCKGLVSGLIRFSQMCLFQKRYKREADRCLIESGCPALIIHGVKDREVAIGGASIYAKFVNASNAKIQTLAADKEGADGHMTVVRPKGTTDALNTDVIGRVDEFIKNTVSEE